MDAEPAGFKYENGTLHISSPLQTLRIRWEGLPEASERTHSGRWRDCAPDIRLLKPGRGNESQAQDEKAGAFQAFRASIPAEITRIVEPFASHQWNMLVLLRYSQEARDLAVSNSVLAYALANNHEIRNTSPRAALCHAMRNARRKQRDICDAIGFPGCEACVRLFRKIPAETCFPPTLRIMRMALRRDPEILKMLAHLKRIHPSIIYLVSSDNVFKLVTPRLLLQIAERGETAENSHVEDLLFNVVYHASQMRHPPALPRFSSIRGVREYHDRMMLALEAARARREQVRELEKQREHFRRGRASACRNPHNSTLFPPPPLPGTEHIIPITTAADLRIEGREQHHCVSSYAHVVRDGQLYVYKILKPERATVSIRKGPGGVWQVNELACACNRPVSTATLSAVLSWLGRYNISP